MSNTVGYKAEVKSLWSVYVGLHTSYKGKNKKLLKRELELIFKNYLSPDCFLQFENMKLKSLVIVNYHVTVNKKINFAHTAHHARKTSITRQIYFSSKIFVKSNTKTKNFN